MVTLLSAKDGRRFLFAVLIVQGSRGCDGVESGVYCVSVSFTVFLPGFFMLIIQYLCKTYKEMDVNKKNYQH